MHPKNVSINCSINNLASRVQGRVTRIDKRNGSNKHTDKDEGKTNKIRYIEHDHARM